MGRVILYKAVIRQELRGNGGMVNRGMREIMDTLHKNARAATPVSSGWMKLNWIVHQKADPRKFELRNTADYAGFRIKGVGAIRRKDMAVGATQRYGNPWPAPGGRVVRTDFREGFQGLDIFTIALKITALKERL